MSKNFDFSEMLNIPREDKWVFRDASDTPFEEFGDRVGDLSSGVNLVTLGAHSVSYAHTYGEVGYVLNSRRIDRSGHILDHTEHDGQRFDSKLDASRAAYNDGALQFMLDSTKVAGL